MNLLPGNFYLLFSFLVIQGFLILIVFYFFIDRIFSSRRRLHEEALIRQKAYDEAEKLLQDTAKDAHGVLEKAHKQAEEIISAASNDATIFKRDFSDLLGRLESKYEKRFFEISENFVKGFNESVNQEKISSLAAFDKTLSDVRQAMAGSISAHQTAINKSIEDLNAVIRTEIAVDVKQVREKISQYEEISKTRLRENIFSILVDASKEIFGQGLNLSDKEEFVLHLIEQGSLDTKFK